MLRGVLEQADRWGVRGWAHDGATPLRLEVFADARLAAVVTADQYRADLTGEAGGRCAFEAWFPEPLPLDRNVEVRVTRPDGRDLPGSPMLYTAPPREPSTLVLPDAGAPLALVVDAAAPVAGRDSASAALLSHMAALAALGFAVRFAAVADAPAVIAETAGLVRVAYLHRLPAAALNQAIRAANPGVHVVFALADLAHVRAERQAAVLGGVPPAGLRAAELAAAREADAVVTHSRAEAVLLERTLPGIRAHCVPWAADAPSVPIPFAERAGVGFIGGFGHAPNQDAAAVLLDEVMPLVWRTRPVPCVLAGFGMPDWLRGRAGGLVRVLHPLPDAAGLWRHIRVSAAPLRFGAGIKGKVLDSIAAGVPCVCSPVAAEGLDLPPALRAGDIADMAATLLRLHEDAAENAAVAARARCVLSGPATVTRALAWAIGTG